MLCLLVTLRGRCRRPAPRSCGIQPQGYRPAWLRRAAARASRHGALHPARAMSYPEGAPPVPLPGAALDRRPRWRRSSPRRPRRPVRAAADGQRQTGEGVEVRLLKGQRPAGQQVQRPEPPPGARSGQVRAYSMGRRMSGAPSWASTAPSTELHQRVDNALPVDQPRKSAPAAWRYSRMASMNSSPLFIMVAESMVIFGAHAPVGVLAGPRAQRDAAPRAARLPAEEGPARGR